MKKKKIVKKKKTVKKTVKKTKKRAAPSKKKLKKSVKKKPIVKSKPKKSVKKPVKTAPPSYIPAANEVSLGEVEDYFGHIGVIALTLKDKLNLGESIHVRGHTTDITQKINSMQIDRAAIQNAKKGDSVGIKIEGKCRKGDKVFRLD